MTRSAEEKARLALRVLGFAGAGLVYLVLAGLSTGAAGAYVVAVGALVVGWRLEAAVDARGWAKLVSVMLATLALLAGSGWAGTVPFQSLVFTLTTILIFALFALGLNLEFGFGGLINFGHVAFMSIGAYVVALLARQGGLWVSQGGIALTVLIAMLASAGAGMLLALPAIRLRADYLAIVTIAAAEILRRFWLNEGEITQGARGVALAARPLELAWLGGVPLIGGPLVGLLEIVWELISGRGSAYALVLVSMAVGATLFFVLLTERLVNSPWGRCVRAIREDEDAARGLGINPTIYKLQVFAIGSAVAGLAGALWAWQIQFIVPDLFQAPITFFAWIMIVIGGVGNNKGAVAGAFIFWTINELSRDVPLLHEMGLNTEQVAAFATLALGLLLVVFMVFRPQGLFGDREELELVE